MSHPLPPKKEVALALLERSSVHVHLDPRSGPGGTGAVVPPWFKKQPQLVLQIGLNMPVPIPDLRLDDEGLSCTLSFNRSPFYCIVPWASVFAMVGDDGRGMVWPDEVPPEIAKQAPAKPEAQEPAATLSAVPGPAAQAPKKGKRAAAPAVEEARASRGEAKSEDKPAGKAKKSKKKRGAAEAAEPELRPMLVAVPRHEPGPSPGSSPAVGDSKESRPERRVPAAPAGSRPGSPNAPSPNGNAGYRRGEGGEGGERREAEKKPAAISRRGPTKPKRELPPYLRVVK